MSLNLLPGIAWGLDEPALALVQRWQQRLPERMQRVFNVAAGWEELTDILNDYRQQSFDDVIVNAGLSLAPQEHGRRIKVMVVGSFPQADGTSWEEAEEQLDSIGMLLTMEQHRLLLHQTVPLVGQPAPAMDLNPPQIEPLRFLPWLLTRMVTGGFTLGEEEFYVHLASLLDALFLTEWEGGAVPGYLIAPFGQTPAQPHHVRLAGFARLPLDNLIADVAAALSRTVLAQAAQQPYEAAIVHAFESKLARWIGEFLAGQRTSIQIEKQILQDLRRLHWPVAALLKETPRILDKEKVRLARETTAGQPQYNIFMRIWQRLRGWCGYHDPAQFQGPDPLQIEALSKNLTKMAEVLQELTQQARTYEGSPAALPPEHANEWSIALHDLVMQRLKRCSKLDVVSGLAWKIEPDLHRHFIAALHEWEISNTRVREVTAALAAGNLLRFSARLQGGLPVQVQALITSLNLGETIRHGAQQVTCATVRLVPGRPPLLIAASEPVPVEHIFF